MTDLNERELAVLQYINDTLTQYGYPPTVRDICRATGIKSTSSVHDYIGRLEEKGYVSRDSRKSRGLRTKINDPRDSSVKVPILGRVTAGQPVFGIENLEGYIRFDPQDDSSEDLFALKIHGTSMIEAGIFDGDLVIVKKTSEANNGDIIVAMIEDETTVKTFYREADCFRLQPENSTMEPIYTKQLEVLGRVVASMRYYE